MNYMTILDKDNIEEFIDSDVTDVQGWVNVTNMEYDKDKKCLKVYFDIGR